MTPRRGPEGADNSTRERILLEASYLFSRWGYHGTSTRGIAKAVGVTQPSLFYHFESKKGIMEALLALSMDRGVNFATAMTKSEGNAAARLYRALEADLKYVTSVPYDLSCTQGKDVMSDPSFARGLSLQTSLHKAWKALIKQGIEQGQFVPYDTVMLQHIIEGVFKEMICTAARRPPVNDSGPAGGVAEFMVRAILIDPADIESIVATAGQLDREDNLTY